MSNSLISPPTRRPILYTTAGLSLLAIYKHTTVGFSSIFPALDSAVRAGALSPENALSAKNNFLTTSAGMLTFAILQRKWASRGFETGYDRAVLGWYVMSSAGLGVAYWMGGWYLPLIPSWVIPGLAGLAAL